MKTAVVIIHGIGEQKPMDTLRRFVEAVVGPHEGRQNYYSKPDTLSETLELRRLQAKGRGGAHFYEYYWAHAVEGTRLSAVLAWLVELASRSGRNVPSGAKSLWWLARIMILVAILLVAGGVAGAVNSWFASLPKFGTVWCSVLGALLLVQYFLVYYLGDAARYLSPRPANIQLRQKIRSQGIKLLRSLHRRNEYDRIIVVGHSLGSVIGYDIISRLWPEYAETLSAFKDPSGERHIRECQKARLPVQPAVGGELFNVGNKLGPKASAEALAEFRAAQVRAFREQRRLGNRWRITDFVTAGSPLTHGMILLAGGAMDFGTRQEQRELPTCPPQPDAKGYGFAATPYDIGEGMHYSPIVLHDGAPFALTRWTNLYFPARLGLFGDFVGGPLAPAFGYGIRDIPVCSAGWRKLLDFTVLSHVRYWAADRGSDRSDAAGCQCALVQLKHALELSERRFKADPWPDAGPPASGNESEAEAHG